MFYVTRQLQELNKSMREAAGEMEEGASHLAPSSRCTPVIDA